MGKKSDSDEVVLQDLEEGKAGQLWKKEKAKTTGYFIFENSNVTKVLTSDPDVSSNDLQITGKNITLIYPKGPRPFIYRISLNNVFP